MRKICPTPVGGIPHRTGAMRTSENPYLPRRWPNMRDSSEMYGKLVALQREIGRQCARGALRAVGPGLERSPRDRMFIRGPASCNHRYGVYDAKAECLQC